MHTFKRVVQFFNWLLGSNCRRLYSIAVAAAVIVIFVVVAIFSARLSQHFIIITLLIWSAATPRAAYRALRNAASKVFVFLCFLFFFLCCFAGSCWWRFAGCKYVYDFYGLVLRFVLIFCLRKRPCCFRTQCRQQQQSNKNKNVCSGYSNCQQY